MAAKIVNIEDLENLQIVSQYQGSADQSQYGGPWGNSETHAHIDVPGGMDADCVVPQMSQEYWSKEGESDVTEDPEDESWEYHPSVLELVEDQDLLDDKEQAGRDAKLDELRAQRDVLADEADHEINKHVDSDPNAIDTEANWKTYRIALRDVTDSYKSGDSGTSALDSFAADMSDFNAWPTKPS